MSKHKSTSHWQAFTSTLSTTLVLVMLGLTVLTTLTAERIRAKLLHELPVTIELRESVSDQEARQLALDLKRENYVEGAVYKSKAQVLKEETAANRFDPTAFTQHNFYRSEIKISVTEAYAQVDSLARIEKELGALPAVSKVDYPDDLVDGLNRNLNITTVVFLVIASLLLIISAALINSTVRLSVYSRRFIIHTMKLVGASWGFIRRPFMGRSFWIGLVAALLADALLGGIVYSLYRYDPSILEYITLENLALMAAAVVVCGLIITLLCTYISVSHFLRLDEDGMYK